MQRFSKQNLSMLLNYKLQIFSKSRYCCNSKKDNICKKSQKITKNIPTASEVEALKIKTEGCILKFNIFGENCHWIRQLKDEEDDPTFDRKYFHHRMYHKYTYNDVVLFLKNFRMPQPSTKNKLKIK